MLSSLFTHAMLISFVVASPLPQLPGAPGSSNSTQIGTPPAPGGSDGSGGIGDIIGGLIGGSEGSGGIEDIIKGLLGGLIGGSTDGSSSSGDAFGDIIESLLAGLGGGLPSPVTKRAGNSSDIGIPPSTDYSDLFGDFISGLIAGEPISDLIGPLLASLVGGSGGVSDIITGLSSSFSKRDGSDSSERLAALLEGLGGSGGSGSGGLASLLEGLGGSGGTGSGELASLIGGLGGSGGSGSGGLASLLGGLGGSGGSGSGGLASLLAGLGGSGSSGSGSSSLGGLGDILGGLGGSTTNDLVDNKGCKDNILIFARGTTEGGNMGSVVGPPLQKSLEQLLPGKFMFQGVSYPASMSGLIDMGSSGGKIVTQLIATTRTQCPDAKIFLSGYSQGAMVVHSGAMNADASAKQKIGGIVLYGDPFNGQAISGVDASKIKTFCAEGDKVCDMQFVISSAHMSYSGTDTAAGAKFIADKIAA